MSRKVQGPQDHDSRVAAGLPAPPLLVPLRVSSQALSLCPGHFYAADLCRCLCPSAGRTDEPAAQGARVAPACQTLP